MKKFVYFSEVCVMFSHARIAFPKNVEIEHNIYFDWPFQFFSCGLLPPNIRVKKVSLALADLEHREIKFLLNI